MIMQWTAPTLWADKTSAPSVPPGSPAAITPQAPSTSVCRATTLCLGTLCATHVQVCSNM